MPSPIANQEVNRKTARSGSPKVWGIRDSFSRSMSLERLFGLMSSPVVILFAVVTALMTRGITQGEFFYHVDEMSHAMNGLFFRDLIVDFP
jgi:hypothetical protein